MKTFDIGTTPRIRSTVSRMSVLSLINACICLGRLCRLSGHSRVPAPPATTTAYRWSTPPSMRLTGGAPDIRPVARSRGMGGVPDLADELLEDVLERHHAEDVA